MKTSQAVSLTRFIYMHLIISRWAVSMADLTSTLISNLGSFLLILMTGKPVLAGLLWNSSFLFPAFLSSWTMSARMFAQTFRTAVPTAELIWWPTVVVSRFIIIVWKYALSARSSGATSLISDISAMGRDLVDWDCWLKISILQQICNKSGYAEKHSMLWELKVQFLAGRAVLNNGSYTNDWI